MIAEGAVAMVACMPVEIDSWMKELPDDPYK
jgi:hypothetical protein